MGEQVQKASIRLGVEIRLQGIQHQGVHIQVVVVIMVFYADFMSYLWLNLLGCALVIVIAQILQLFRGEK